MVGKQSTWVQNWARSFGNFFPEYLVVSIDSIPKQILLFKVVYLLCFCPKKKPSAKSTCYCVLIISLKSEVFFPFFKLEDLMKCHVIVAY